MKQYHKMLEDILEQGEETSNRTGINTKSIFGYQMRFNLQEGFPAVTTKKLAWRSVVGELLWFLEGSTDERRLAELTYGKDRKDLTEKTTIWTANADTQAKSLGYVNTENMKQLGPVYGHQWRNFDGYGEIPGTDQIKLLINQIRTNRDSRRLILSAWNPNQINAMALPPCHAFVQFRVSGDKLHCQMYQRSADAFLGVPFNIASYSLLTHLIADECNYLVGDFIHTIGDAHIYTNHVDQVKKQLSRNEFPLPKLSIHSSFNLYERIENGFKLDDINKFTLVDYKHHGTIKAPMAV